MNAEEARKESIRYQKIHAEEQIKEILNEIEESCTKGHTELHTKFLAEVTIKRLEKLNYTITKFSQDRNIIYW